MDQGDLPEDLKMLEQYCNRSRWLNQNEHEPCVGDVHCTPLAESRGTRGMSLYTAFVRNRSDGAYGCHFAPCFAYHTPSEAEAIRHQREHHFNHKPFIRVPVSGNHWYASFFFCCTAHSIHIYTQ